MFSTVYKASSQKNKKKINCLQGTLKYINKSYFVHGTIK